MTEEERNRALVLRYIEASNRNDARAIANMYADDSMHTVMGTTPISGVYTKQQMLAGAGGVFAPFPDGLRFRLVGMIAEGDKVAFEVESVGQHVSGAIYNNHYHWLMRFRNGELVESKEYLDTQLVAKVLCGSTSE
jgi:ketosteroid isomerase-like protein